MCAPGTRPLQRNMVGQIIQTLRKVHQLWAVGTALCTALHCTALHCTALHCTALHCTVHTVQWAQFVCTLSEVCGAQGREWPSQIAAHLHCTFNTAHSTLHCKSTHSTLTTSHSILNTKHSILEIYIAYTMLHTISTVNSTLWDESPMVSAAIQGIVNQIETKHLEWSSPEKVEGFTDSDSSTPQFMFEYTNPSLRGEVYSTMNSGVLELKLHKVHFADRFSGAELARQRRTCLQSTPSAVSTPMSTRR